MIEIEKPRIETAEMKSDGTYGRFVLEPLERATVPLWATAYGAYCSPRFPVLR